VPECYVRPVKGAVAEATAALEIRRELPPSRRAGLTTQEAGEQGVGSGVARARDIVAGKRIEAYQALRFFRRFAGMVAKARNEGKDARSSKAILAWMLWGGDPLYRQARRAVEKDRARRSAAKPRNSKRELQRYLRERFGV